MIRVGITAREPEIPEKSPRTRANNPSSHGRAAQAGRRLMKKNQQGYAGRNAAGAEIQRGGTLPDRLDLAPLACTSPPSPPPHRPTHQLPHTPPAHSLPKPRHPVSSPLTRPLARPSATRHRQAPATERPGWCMSGIARAVLQRPRTLDLPGAEESAKTETKPNGMPTYGIHYTREAAWERLEAGVGATAIQGFHTDRKRKCFVSSRGKRSVHARGRPSLPGRFLGKPRPGRSSLTRRPGWPRTGAGKRSGFRAREAR